MYGTRCRSLLCEQRRSQIHVATSMLERLWCGKISKLMYGYQLRCVLDCTTAPVDAYYTSGVISPILVLMRCVRKTVRWVSIVMDVSDLPLDRVRAVRKPNETYYPRVLQCMFLLHVSKLWCRKYLKVVTVLRRVRSVRSQARAFNIPNVT